MTETDTVACDDIYHKCQMRPLLTGLAADRAREQPNLGKIGAVVFQELDIFLQHVGRPLRTKNSFPWRPKHTSSCVLAIGDIHGDFLALLSALFLGGVIDELGFWCGRDTIVVQLGDIFDRGGRATGAQTSNNPREEIDILQYIHGLNREARLVGGAVVSLVGNHEADAFRYMSSGVPTRYETELQMRGWGGIAKKRALFRPMSPLAQYFARYKPLIVQINDFLFCHGGLVPNVIKVRKNITEMNKIWWRYLTGQIQNLPADIRDIFWNRDLGAPSVNTDNNARCVRMVDEVFRMLSLDPATAGLVIAHTPQVNGIPLYCAGKVWRTDVMLSEGFGRRSTPIEVLRIVFNVGEWSGQTKVQIIKGRQHVSNNTIRESVETHSFVAGLRIRVEKVSSVSVQRVV